MYYIGFICTHLQGQDSVIFPNPRVLSHPLNMVKLMFSVHINAWFSMGTSSGASRLQTANTSFVMALNVNNVFAVILQGPKWSVTH